MKIPKVLKLTAVLALFAQPVSAVELEPSFTYQGRFSNSSNVPLVGNVGLRFQIYSASGKCMLYEESQQIVLTKSQNGVASVKVGSLLKNSKRSDADPGLKMTQIFSNEKEFQLSTPSCVAGYTPKSGDARWLRVFINDGKQEITLSPDQLIASVPTALVAETLQGLTLGDLDQRYVLNNRLVNLENGKLCYADGKNIKCDRDMSTTVGAKGDKGEPGTAGQKGDKGDTGSAGVAGPQGLKGDTGAVGAKGANGERGLQGERGEKGLTGDQGLKGDKGDKGDKGEQGLVGAAGPKGERGLTGERGAQGLKGDQGLPGAIGATGPKGERGEQGFIGERGLAGVSGPKGDQGLQGIQGPKGDSDVGSCLENFAGFGSTATTKFLVPKDTKVISFNFTPQQQSWRTHNGPGNEENFSCAGTGGASVIYLGKTKIGGVVLEAGQTLSYEVIGSEAVWKYGKVIIGRINTMTTQRCDNWRITYPYGTLGATCPRETGFPTNKAYGAAVLWK